LTPARRTTSRGRTSAYRRWRCTSTSTGADAARFSIAAMTSAPAAARSRRAFAAACSSLGSAAARRLAERFPVQFLNRHDDVADRDGCGGATGEHA
jgi:hypothetical protein